MEGKVIKEESGSVGSSPCSPATPLPPQSHSAAACPVSTSSSVASTTANSAATLSTPPNSLPSGKENRRVGSPLTTSEILTRSRSKVLTKENCHHSHHRMSESPKALVVGGLSGSQESIMPGVKSSSSSHHSHSSHSHGTGQGFGGHPFPSPHSTTSQSSAALGNGSSGMGGRTPSPPSASNTNNPANSSSSSSTGRTPASSSNNSGTSASASSRSDGSGHGNGRYIVKIKRFLGTLLHFGCDISLEVGERVRNLVFNLVSGHLSIEEFHHSLQEVTSFPLRPFVLPFLRAHLPLLQREISHLARISKQSPLSFIRSHEQVIIESGSSPGEPCDIFHSEASDMAISGKRKSSESFYENGDPGDSSTYTSTPKRHHHGALFSPFSALVGGSGPASVAATAAELRDYYAAGYPLLTSAAAASHHNHSHHHDSATTNPSTANSSTNGGMTPKGAEDEWKNIHVMLNCILQMVEKTKRALSILQNRTFHNEAESSGTSSSSSSTATASWLRRPAFSTMDNSEDFKRQAGEMMAQALRATEDRVAEVKRRAEEAVQEVKRQALVELQRAVAAAETRACEAVATERARLERAFLRTPAESLMLGAPVDPETCWNCGRKAHETCSGCNMARYCSSFCQHKDWEHHHTVCGRHSAAGDRERERERERSSASNNSDSKNLHVQENSNSSPINVSHPSPDNRSSGSN